MTSDNKISGKIINYNETYYGEIIFDENIININNREEINSDNYIIPGFVDLHCHGGVMSENEVIIAKQLGLSGITVDNPSEVKKQLKRLEE